MNLWKCMVCGYLHEGKSPPDNCPNCGADLNRFILQEPLPPDLEEAVRAAFAGESKAAVRNRAYAEKARQEGYLQVERLFKAVGEAERVHAAEYLRFLEGVVGSTEENLRQAFESEMRAREEHYPPLIKIAFDHKREDLAWSMVRARDVEERHALLYKDALQAMIADRDIEYHVCQVCGYVFQGELPDNCPVCRAEKNTFKAIA